MPRTNRIGALLLPFVLLLATACAAGPSTRPPVAYRDAEQPVAPAPPPPGPAPVPPLGAPASDQLNWQDCTAQTRARLGAPAGQATYSCSRMLTTLDSPESPTRGLSRTALLRVGSGRVPLVVVNDAGDEPGTVHAARLAEQLPPDVLSTFQLIGVDRRGTGQSDGADCLPEPQRQAITGFDPRATGRPAMDQLLDSVRDASQQCLLTLDDRLPAYDTWRAAADLDQLRTELRVPKLHAIGRGEGSRLLATYAQRYPDSVGRMVFDGAPDPLGDAMGEAEGQARSAEQTFDVFADDCRRTGCPLGPDPRATVSGLIERNRTAPDEGGSVSAGAVVQAVLTGLRDRADWPRLAQALNAANHGDGNGVRGLVAPRVAPHGGDPPRLDGDMITSCNDTTLRVPPQRIAEAAQDWSGRHPLFGGAFAQRLLWCSLWPVPQEALPVPRSPGVPPVPVISTAHDPLRPASGTEHLAGEMPSAVRLTWQGAGHGALGRSDCVDASVSRFLVRGDVPTPGTACPA